MDFLTNINNKEQTMGLAILGGAILLLGLAMAAIVVMSFLYLDDPVWFMVPSSIVMSILLVVQASVTGIWSVALITLLPLVGSLIAFWWAGAALYETRNPVKLFKLAVSSSWSESKLVEGLGTRLRTQWDKIATFYTNLYWAGVNAGAKLRGA